MFLIGDRIVHPLHGAGVIEDIVERTIDGAPAQSQWLAHCSTVQWMALLQFE